MNTAQILSFFELEHFYVYVAPLIKIIFNGVKMYFCFLDQQQINIIINSEECTYLIFAIVF